MSSKLTPGALVFLFAAVYFTTTTDGNYLPAILAEIAHVFGTGTLWANAPVIAFNIMSGLSAVSFGFAARRLGPHRLFWLGLGGFTAASVLNATVPGILLFTLARGLTGASSALVSLSLLMLIGRHVPEGSRGRSLGVWVAGNMLALLCVPLWMLSLKIGLWRLPFVVFAVLGVIWLVRSRQSLGQAQPVAQSGPEISTLRALQAPAVWALIGLGLLFQMSQQAMFAEFSFWCRDEFGLRNDQLWSYLLVGAFGAIVGCLAMGRLADRLGSHRTLLVCNVLLMPLFVLVPVLAINTWILYPMFFIVAFLAAGFVVPYHAITLEAVPSSIQGAVIGLRNTVSYVGLAAGAFAGGWIYQATGRYFNIAVFSGLVSLIALMVNWYLFTARSRQASGFLVR